MDKWILVLQVLVSDFKDTMGCNFVLVEVTRDSLRQFLSRMDLVKDLKTRDSSAYQVKFFDGFNVVDSLGDVEDQEPLLGCLSTKQWALLCLSDSAFNDAEYQRVDGCRQSVEEGEVVMEFYPKHGDELLASASITREMIAELGELLDLKERAEAPAVTG